MARPTKQDLLIYKALRRAIDEDLLRVYLDYSRVSRPTSPVYDPWECLMPILLPVLFGLFLMIAVNLLFGLIIIAASILLYTTYVRKKLHKRLIARTKYLLARDYRSMVDFWKFGGLILVNRDNRKIGCVAPEGDWKDFVVRNFAHCMTEPKPADEKKEEAINDLKAEKYGYGHGRRHG